MESSDTLVRDKSQAKKDKDDEDDRDNNPARSSNPKALYAPKYDQTLRNGRRRRQRKWIGLDPNKPVKPHEKGTDHLFWCRMRTTFQEPFAEFLGTMILACFNNGSIAQAKLGAGITTAPGGFGYGTYNSVAWGSGIGSMLGIYVGGDSGAYLNPAITFANCMFRGLPWREFPIIVFSQFAGAFVGNGLVYAQYEAAIDWVEGHGNRTIPPNPVQTASIFASYPQTFAPKSTQAFGILLPAALVTMSVAALKDDYNNGVDQAGGNLFPLLIFFLSYGVSVAFGFEASAATNPALDLSGRALSNLVGYPREVWSSFDWFFWFPLVLPFLGATFGSFVYDVLVYTGPSPINSRWMGAAMLFDYRENIKNKLEREKRRDDPENEQV